MVDNGRFINLSLNARGRLLGGIGRKITHLEPTLHPGRCDSSTQKEPKKAPSGTPADGAEGLPHCGLLFEHFGSCFNTENDPENGPRIMHKMYKLWSSFCYSFDLFLPTLAISVTCKILKK